MADYESRDINSNNILPVAASSGPTGAGTFASAQNVTIANSQLVDVCGNYIHNIIQINNPSVSAEVMAPLPPVNHSSMMFTGRSACIQRLKDHFVSNGMEKRKSFLLHGLGGIGKTQICLKFIEENEDFLTYFGLMLLQKVPLISDSGRLLKQIMPLLKLSPQLHILSNGFLESQIG